MPVAVGGPAGEEKAIVGVKEGKWRSWAAGERKSAWIATAKSASGREYLKAESDWGSARDAFPSAGMSVTRKLLRYFGDGGC